MNKARLLLCLAMCIPLSAAAGACSVSYLYLGSDVAVGCTNPDVDHLAACGIPDPCHCLDDGGAALGIKVDPGWCTAPDQRCPDADPDAAADGPPADGSTGP
jgi:hypothetical protein